GRVVGRHRGAMNYTVGQRRGLGVALGEPAYVLRVDASRNRVVVGREEDLLQDACTVREVNWVSCDPPRDTLDVDVKIRYRTRPTPARVSLLDGGRAQIHFQEPVRAISPGQSAVFYREDMLLGGGIIDSRPAEGESPSVEGGLKSE